MLINLFPGTPTSNLPLNLIILLFMMSIEGSHILSSIKKYLKKSREAIHVEKCWLLLLLWKYLTKAFLRSQRGQKDQEVVKNKDQIAVARNSWEPSHVNWNLQKEENTSLLLIAIPQRKKVVNSVEWYFFVLFHP